MALTQIQTAMLADSAVTDAKLAASLDLTSKTILLPGSVGARLVKRDYSSGASPQTTTTSMSSYADITGCYLNYYPLAAGNTLLIRMKTGPSIYTAAGTGQYFGVTTRINCGGTYSDTAGLWFRTDNGSCELQTNQENTMKYVTTGTGLLVIKGEWKSNLRSGSTQAGIGQWYSSDNTNDKNFIEVLEFSGNVS